METYPVSKDTDDYRGAGIAMVFIESEYDEDDNRIDGTVTEIEYIASERINDPHARETAKAKIQARVGDDDAIVTLGMLSTWEFCRPQTRREWKAMGLKRITVQAE
ncbi:hypothetical protein LCGC14_2641820 [marine sediment metagenome]|uniref:Uncharacterized protein n=1 Tax=marine sediment metagenome TaxID=412755 RepID=A0A0F8ZX84_9ZZZZ